MVKIICDSINPVGDRLTTFQIRFPKCLLAELNTHRMLSRNAGSSRAKPAKVMRQLATFKPSVWLENQKGMQGYTELTGRSKLIAQFSWWLHRQSSLFCNWLAADVAGLHKQYSNRLLETHAYIDVVVSSTEWDNFFMLRTHKDTQPEFRDIAIEMKRLLENSKPKKLSEGDWHLPYILDSDEESIDDLIKISVARCARVSYKAFSGDGNVVADKILCDKLFGSIPMHLSPTEHVAMSLSESVSLGNFVGFKQYRKSIVGEAGR